MSGVRPFYSHTSRGWEGEWKEGQGEGRGA
jgi:hypothetical protein